MNSPDRDPQQNTKDELVLPADDESRTWAKHYLDLADKALVSDPEDIEPRNSG